MKIVKKIKNKIKKDSPASHQAFRETPDPFE